MFDKIEDAIKAIRGGGFVVVLDDEDRENEGDLVIAAEKITAEAVNFMMKDGRGLICVPVSREIADRLNFYPMVEENKEIHRCDFTVSVDFKHGTTTGISASDRAKTILAISEFSSSADDFVRPGHVFPLRAKDGGVLVRAGHTEASVDLAKLAGLSPAASICEITRNDGEMMRRDELVEFAKKNKFPIVTIKDLIAYRHATENLVTFVAEANLPTEFGDFLMKIYVDKIHEKEHIVLMKGKIDNEKGVLLRVQSECVTGEVFKSLKCDCGNQLEYALEKISEEGDGVVLYIRQEGRGIGLVNKVKAYALQEQGFDTVTANEKLGLKADLRDYGIGAQILADLGVRNIRLMTNNPTKVVGLEAYGIKISERLPIEVPINEKSIAYMKTKKDKMGHILKHV
ncbi:MAG: bifunctional 3,4-dihydroxy-2-butanone-4-phosphate synthase/GTP cyclohydrolase II [Candidatus Gracilibacteria bacterium]|jgi:3,4-dihydroxy 2-butanone 4-phosphate synthase/GTP cyclohydrolase II